MRNRLLALVELQAAFGACPFDQVSRATAARAGQIVALGGAGYAIGKGAFPIEQGLPPCMQQGPHLGDIFGTNAQIESRGTGMAMACACLLPIQDGRDLRLQTGVKKLLGVGDAGADTGNHFRVLKFLQGLLFVHGAILFQVSNGIQIPSRGCLKEEA